MLKAYVVAIGGIVVCGAILGCIAVICVDHLVSDDPVEDVFWGSLVFGGGALAVLAISGRAALRAYRGASGEGPLTWIAYAVPVLALVGVAGGVVFGVRVVSEHHEHSDSVARHACGEAFDVGAPLTAPERARCLGEARRCRRFLHEYPPEVGRGVELEPDPSLADLSIDDAAMVRCLRAAGVRR